MPHLFSPESHVDFREQPQYMSLSMFYPQSISQYKLHIYFMFILRKSHVVVLSFRVESHELDHCASSRPNGQWEKGHRPDHYYTSVKEA